VLLAVRRALFIVVAALVLLPGAAEAYYVDISITGAGRVYETTDANELDEHCPDAVEGFASPGTTPTGTLGASCRAGDASGDYGWGWIVRYVAEPAAGYRFDGWVSDGRTSPRAVACDGSNAGAACQFATHESLQLRARFVDDTPPAMQSLTGPNQVVNGPATFTFSAAADPTFGSFECRVAGVHDWQSCTSGRQENPSSGTYTFQVRARDSSNNVSAEMTTQWTVDKTMPETTLLPSGPHGFTNSRTAQFDFTGNEAGTFVCSLDGVRQACGSGQTYTGLADGTHTFTVAARDTAGNEDPSPASRSFTVDTAPPVTTLNASGPSGPTSSASATFQFSSEPDATFTCALNGDETPCNSGTKSYNGLPDGTYTFTVAATDRAGNDDGTPATRTFTVDTVAPNTILTNAVGPSGSTASRTARFEFSSPDATASFRCSLDGAAPSPCTSPVELSDLAVGSHTFSVVAVDTATNQDASPATRTWTVTAPPASSTAGGSGSAAGDAPQPPSASGGLPQPTTAANTSPRSGDSTSVTPPPTIAGPSRGTARLDRRGRFTIPGLKVRCPAGCAVSVRVTGSRRLVVASARLTPNRQGALRVMVSKKGLAAVRRAKRLRTTVVVTVTPSGGGAKLTKRLTVTLRAPKRGA
jgi:hypothetical protein